MGFIFEFLMGIWGQGIWGQREFEFRNLRSGLALCKFAINIVEPHRNPHQEIS